MICLKSRLDDTEKLLDVCAVNHVQVFLTTHSLESIGMILEDCHSRLEDVAVYHIRNRHGQTAAKKYSGEKLSPLSSSQTGQSTLQSRMN